MIIVLSIVLDSLKSPGGGGGGGSYLSLIFLSDCAEGQDFLHRGKDIPVNHPEKIYQSDSFLPNKVFA